jgi:thioredoxin-dependent peroxiredoxin
MTAIGSDAPDFTLAADDGSEWRLSDHAGNVVVLLFYPQNETLVCTRQLCSVRDNWQKYLETRATIVAISDATADAHREFAQAYRLPILLLADQGRKVTTRYTKHWLYPTSWTRAVVVVDAEGVVRDRDVMLRAFRPSDDEIITSIYTARGDAFNTKYDQLKQRAARVTSLRCQ